MSFPYEQLGPRIRQAARICIIPWYKGHAYVQLLGPVGVTTLPLVRDFYVWNQAGLVARHDLSTFDGHENPPSQGTSMTADHMQASAASDFVTRVLALSWEPIVWDTQQMVGDSPLNSPKRRKVIYDLLIKAMYSYQEQEPNLLEVIGRRMLFNPERARVNLNDNFDSLWSKLPPHIRHIQFSILFNTLNTKRRYMTITYPDKMIRDAAPKSPCFRCGKDDDGIMHLANCPVIIMAYNIYASNIKFKLSINNIHAFSFHDALFLNFPTNTIAANAIVVFNYVSWYQTRDYFQFLDRYNTEEAAGRIADIASREFIFRLELSRPKKKISTSRYGSAGRRTDAQTTACNDYVLDLLENLPDDAIVAATDGACLGNPGPAGAGAYIYYPNTPSRLAHSYEKEISIAIGKGTNNKGEAWAIGATIETIISSPPQLILNKRNELHVLIDSSYCIGILTKGWKCQTNLSIFDNIRTLINTIPSHIEILFHWVPGHVDCDLNNHADMLASLAAKRSKNSRGLTVPQMQNLILNCKFLPN